MHALEVIYISCTWRMDMLYNGLLSCISSQLYDRGHCVGGLKLTSGRIFNHGSWQILQIRVLSSFQSPSVTHLTAYHWIKIMRGRSVMFFICRRNGFFCLVYLCIYEFFDKKKKVQLPTQK